MTPKEKCDEFVKRFNDAQDGRSVMGQGGKKCALICVDEILRALDEQKTFTAHKIHTERYYNEVKKEIEKL
jgi:hypothetical protein